MQHNQDEQEQPRQRRKPIIIMQPSEQGNEASLTRALYALAMQVAAKLQREGRLDEVVKESKRREQE
jgi:hypothetical protein